MAGGGEIKDRQSAMHKACPICLPDAAIVGSTVNEVRRDTLSETLRGATNQAGNAAHA
jgi:hypothetical protein